MYQLYSQAKRKYLGMMARGKGVGSGLLRFVKLWAKDEELVLLIVWPGDKAYPFYERAGFAREADPLVLHLDED